MDLQSDNIANFEARLPADAHIKASPIKASPIQNISQSKELHMVMTDIEIVRLKIGDTTVPYVFTDAEITYFLTSNSNNINLAAADALEAWMAKYATAPDSEKIGDYAYTQKIIQNMNKLKTELREKDASTPYLTWAEIDLTAGSSITAEDD